MERTCNVIRDISIDPSNAFPEAADQLGLVQLGRRFWL
jgi:hypothetical protein